MHTRYKLSRNMQRPEYECIWSAVLCVIKLVFFTHMPQANISLALANPQGRWHHIKLIAAGLSS